jgi:hypothetical protein
MYIRGRGPVIDPPLSYRQIMVHDETAFNAIAAAGAWCNNVHSRLRLTTDHADEYAKKNWDPDASSEVISATSFPAVFAAFQPLFEKLKHWRVWNNYRYHWRRTLLQDPPKIPAEDVTAEELTDMINWVDILNAHIIFVEDIDLDTVGKVYPKEGVHKRIFVTKRIFDKLQQSNLTVEDRQAATIQVHTTVLHEIGHTMMHFGPNVPIYTGPARLRPQPITPDPFGDEAGACYEYLLHGGIIDVPIDFLEAPDDSGVIPPWVDFTFLVPPIVVETPNVNGYYVNILVNRFPDLLAADTPWIEGHPENGLQTPHDWFRSITPLSTVATASGNNLVVSAKTRGGARP